MDNGDKKSKFSKYKIAAGILLVVVLLILFGNLIARGNLQILNPKGLIAAGEKSFMITAVLLMLIVVIPMFVAAAVIAYKFRADNTSARYNPTLHNSKVVLVLWAIPALLVAVLATLTWQSAHKLDPYRSINSNAAPITIQVIALRWKWLFIYPQQNIATVNFIEFPQNVPVHFELTADAPMNSFWIPQLGGQMYAMAGMSSKLNLMATSTGDFNGSAAEINGAGFAGMKFMAKSTSQNDFDNWVRSVKNSDPALSLQEYNSLAAPSENNATAEYSSVQQNLYNIVIDKFMMPTQGVQ